MDYRNTVLATTAFTLAFATAALAADPPLQMSYPTDASLDCAAIAAEMARMDSVIVGAGGQITSANGQAQAANLGASVAVNGALYSGALGKVPGLGMFANKAAQLAQKRAADKAKEQEAVIQTANARKALLTGLFQGKSCGATAATTTPAAMPLPASAPAR